MENNMLGYEDALKNAVSQRGKIEKAVDELVEKGVENIFFVGCGGSLAIMYPCWYIMQQESKIPSYIFNAGEFNNLRHKMFGEKSVIITASYSGTTPETNKAVEIAKEKGATSIGLTGKADSPLGKAVDYCFVNNAKLGATDSNMIMIYQIFLRLMEKLEGYDRYEEIVKAIDTLPVSLPAIKELAEEKAKEFAKTYKDETHFFTIGSGLGWGEAYAYGICILEEMQWLFGQPVRAEEYFHGSFEIVTEEGPNLIILKGEDFARPLVERVIDFSKRYTDRMVIIDTKDYPLPGVAEDLRPYFTPMILSAVLARFSDNLAEIRKHPLSIRRYMGKVSY